MLNERGSDIRGNDGRRKEWKREEYGGRKQVENGKKEGEAVDFCQALYLLFLGLRARGLEDNAVLPASEEGNVTRIRIP